MTTLQYPQTTRMHLGFEVANLERSLDFYRRFLGTEPVKLRTGYAKFELTQPALNLTLNEGQAARAAHPGGSRHFGLEVGSPQEVARLGRELGAHGLRTRTEDGVECCHARQDKVWVVDPDGNPWEVFTVLAHLPEAAVSGPSGRDSGSCCHA